MADKLTDAERAKIAGIEIEINDIKAEIIPLRTERDKLNAAIAELNKKIDAKQKEIANIKQTTFPGLENMKAQDVIDLLPEAKSNYDQMVNAMDVVPASKIPRGYEDVVDLIAQTLNGGFEQYIANGYLDQLPTAMSFLKQLGSVSKEAAALLSKLSDDALEFEELEKGNYSEDEYEAAAKRLEAWDDWLYKSDRDEKIAGEMVKYLKDKKILVSEE